MCAQGMSRYTLPLLFPGQETTANTMCFAVILVHQHPEVLERLLAEIDEVLGNKTSVSAEDLEKLKYTEQVRLFTAMIMCWLSIVHGT